jgi:hypothetical protein
MSDEELKTLYAQVDGGKDWAIGGYEHAFAFANLIIERLTKERDQIIEKCAEVCGQKRAALIQTGERWKAAGAYECAAAIRAMKNDPVA